MLRLPRHKMVRRIPLKVSFFHRSDVPLYTFVGGLVAGSLGLFLASPHPRISVPNVIYMQAVVSHPEVEILLKRILHERCNSTGLVLLSGEKVNQMTFNEDTQDKQLSAATKKEESRVV